MKLICKIIICGFIFFAINVEAKSIEDLIGIQIESVKYLMEDPEFREAYEALALQGRVNASMPTKYEVDLIKKATQKKCGKPCPKTGSCTQAELNFKEKECPCPKTAACTK